jgi:hypothetical protein
MDPRRQLLIALASLLCSGSLLARGPVKTDEAVPLTGSEMLMPGQFEWQPDRSPQGDVSITVNLSLQIMEVYRGGVLIARSSISSGGYGHSTPNGSFNILGKEVMHYSNLYHHAPMPFMQRLTMEGVALHAGYLPGVPSSHGCIRLPHAFARKLFEITSCGNLVTVTGSAKEYRQPIAQNTRSRSRKEKPANVTPVDSSGTRYLAGEVVELTSVKPQKVEKVAAAPAQPAAMKGSKSMAQLEEEELGIRNNQSLSRVERQQELNRVWSEQRALMGQP